MTVREMIEMLFKLDNSQEVVAYDPDYEDYLPVTGCTYCSGEVRLYCDSDEDYSIHDREVIPYNPDDPFKGDE